MINLKDPLSMLISKTIRHFTLQKSFDFLWLAASLIFLCFFLVPNPLMAGKDSVYRVAKFEIWARSENAVKAKQKAIIDGRREAFSYLMERMLPISMHRKVPKVSDKTLQGLVSSLAVRTERNSANEYLATVDYIFNTRAVRSFLQRHKIAFIDQQSPRVTVLPVIDPSVKSVLKSKDMVALEAEWIGSWRTLDIHNSLVPLQISKRVDGIDQTVSKAVIASDPQAIERLLSSYNTKQLLMVYLAAGNKKGTIRLLVDGIDGIGNLAYRKDFAGAGKDVGKLFDDISAFAHGVIVNRWKLVNKPRTKKSASHTADEALNGWTTTGSVETTRPQPQQKPVGELANVPFRVQFSGMREWQNIRRNLGAIPGVAKVDVRSLTARGADVVVSCRRGQSSLFQSLASHQLSAFQHSGKWYLMSR